MGPGWSGIAVIPLQKSVQREDCDKGVPFLVVCLDFSHILFEDVECENETSHGLISRACLLLGSQPWDREYADDTVLLSTPNMQVQSLLHLLQKHSVVPT